ncbi:MAG TPA: class I SAM-dependent methyltransferase [Bacteroidales bacterium]|jgi:ubiquinone/menaquinone biosynthesis C-methylase UbiE|nr:class I SAM-dependent methyltransferase [Bacteroidales bacterium]
MKFNFREMLFRIWYWYVNKVDKNAEVLFMNYGYSGDDLNISLDEQNEANRYSIQLYHHLAKETDIKEKDIIEIGCGRGGGLSYIAKTFAPATAKGIDLDSRAASFCNKYYQIDGLSFSQGDAQNLDLKDNSYDVVLNIESSHRYPDMKAFLGEVSRILRPNGHFLYTDFRYDFEMEDLKKELESSGLTVLKERLITKEVVAALEHDDKRRRVLIKKLAPKFLHKIALDFAGTVGSNTYNQFATQKYIYYSYVLKKQ